MFKTALLTIGDEICIGQTVNTNAAEIAQELIKKGTRIITHSVIEDDKEMMLAELKRLTNIADLVITTGGLGPTHDDITKDVLTEFFRDEQIWNEDVLKSVEETFKSRGIKLTERNRLQARVPSKAKIFINEVGTAPGMLFIHGDSSIFSIPGVPAEMRYFLDNHLAPFVDSQIRQRNEEALIYKNLHVAGIFESSLADLIGEPQSLKEGCSLAYLPSYKGIRLRLGAYGADKEEAQKKLENLKNEIYEKAGKYVYGEDDESLASVCGKMLRDRGLTLSVAESCTGGLLGGELTEIAGSSDYFRGGAISYSNDAKVKSIKVKQETLDKYGAVSEETALEMAHGVREAFDTDIGISITGIAGPGGGTDEKPVGLVYIAIADKQGAKAWKNLFGKSRQPNRERSVGQALTLLYKKMINDK
ncbi:MAG: competence/damage-inducible protein A [Candidatus Kapaibacterium sp.]